MNTKTVAAATLVLLLLAIVVFAPGFSGAVWASRLEDFAHGPTFGCVAVLLLLMSRELRRSRELPIGAQYALAFIGAVALGLATEAAQTWVARDAAWSDALHDTAGALAFLALFSVIDPAVQMRSPNTRALRAMLGAALLVYLSAPMLRAGYEYHLRSRQFPVLADFAPRYDKYFIWSARSITDHGVLPPPLARAPGERALRVRFTEQRYPGLDLHEPVADWSAYEQLMIDLANPTDQALELVVRVHDERHNQRYVDRYNDRFIVPPHTREVLKIPLATIEHAPHGRRMDMRAISGLIIFRVDGNAAAEMYLSRIWLE